MRLPIRSYIADSEQPAERGGRKANVPLEELPALDGISVLIVDDEPSAREVTALFLSQRGARVTAVGSAREALAAISESIPDVLVSDIGMPDEDGYSLMQRIRSLEPEQGVRSPRSR